MIFERGTLTNITKGSEGRVNRADFETIRGVVYSDREIIGLDGFDSLPDNDNTIEGWIIAIGSRAFIIATNDRDVESPIEDGEKGIYFDENNYVKFKDDGEIDITTEKDVILNATGKIFINSGTVELGDGTLLALVNALFLTAYDLHVHSGVTVGAGFTGVPTVLSLPGQKTMKTKAS